ncbi:TPA: hypothetical protein GXZ34_02250 [bacterium]|nr:hypothetical protein [bacterium]
MLDLFTLNDWLVYLPIIVFSIVFLVGFLIGVIRGRYKVVRRFIYVILFMGVMLFLTPKLIEVGLNITIPILNKSGNQYINEFIASNPDISEIANEIPSLVELIPALISALVSPILYIVLVWVGLIAFFPIYLIYLLVFKLIYKRKKYEVDENGEYIRDGGHRKIKVRYKKHRLTGGLIRGIQSVFVFSIVLMPINAANRMYNVAKSELENESISLCASIEFLNEYQQICDYLDLYNASYLAKAQKINVVDELMFKQLTTMKLNGEKFNLENEVNTFIRAFMKVEKSNIISVLGESEIELETLSTIDFEVIKDILDTLFSSKIFSNLVTEGVNYGVKLATPELRNLLEDQEFVVNLKYDVPSIKKEIRIIINIFKIIADNDLVGYLDGGVEDPLQLKNSISEQTIHNLIDNLLELQLARELMPGLLSKYGASFGVKVPTTTINWDNEKSLYKRVVSLLYLVDDYSSVDLILDNLNDENIQLVAALLDDLDSSSMLEDVLETTIPKLLNTYLGGLTISSEVIASIESWEEELNIIKAGVEIYLSYTNDDTIPLEKISDTLALIKRSDLMMDLMPKALNIALPLIDTSFENIPSGLNWSQEIDYMITIVDNLLTIGEMTEFDIELLNNEDKRESATNIVVAAASSGVFKGFFNNILLEMSGPLLSEIGIELTHDDLNLVSDWRVELDSILSLYNDYIVSDDTGYSFSLDGLDETKVTALFTTFESLTILTNHRVPILVNMIEKANIMNEAELISFRAIDKSSVDYDTEKGILIDLVSNQSLQDTLTNLDLASVDVYALGSLLNKIYGDNSILIRDFTTNKLLAQSNISIVLTEEKI